MELSCSPSILFIFLGKENVDVLNWAAKYFNVFFFYGTKAHETKCIADKAMESRSTNTFPDLEVENMDEVRIQNKIN